jgi:hypothetical protein
MEDLRVVMGMTAQDMLPAIQSHARSQGWPEHIIRALRVEVDDDGQIDISVPGYLRKELDDLEYGSEDSSPTAVLGNFVHSSVGGEFVESTALNNLEPIMVEFDRMFL